MKKTTKNRKDPLAEARASAWLEVRKFLPAIEAGARALRESQEREIDAFRHFGAEIVSKEAETLEKLAVWLKTGDFEKVA